ncbi:MAG: hypothetical protein K2W82_13785 [Candidatus Obscuribacterales bacterium]|nr:hypothetical protein [Candidatus Obscuribacterales bacterium]
MSRADIWFGGGVFFYAFCAVLALQNKTFWFVLNLLNWVYIVLVIAGIVRLLQGKQSDITRNDMKFNLVRFGWFAAGWLLARLSLFVAYSSGYLSLSGSDPLSLPF